MVVALGWGEAAPEGYQFVTYGVLEAGVLSLSVLADDGEVDVAVAGGHAGDRLAQDDRGVDVELLAHRNVPRGVAGALLGGVENTCARTIWSSAWLVRKVVGWGEVAYP